MKNRKGLTLIFEQVILFAVSVTIFLVSFAAFTVYQDFYLSVANNNQLDQTTEWISAHILKIAETEASEATIVLAIPREIGDSIYSISLEDDDSGERILNVTHLLTGETKTSTLYELDEPPQPFTLSGTINSAKGKVTIIKVGNTISIV